MKLELKHLAAYLPYGLQMKSIGTIGIFGTGTLKAVALHPGTGGEDLLSVFVEFTKDNSRQIIFKKRDKDIIIKPLLRPLSDIADELTELTLKRHSDVYTDYAETVRMIEAELEYTTDIALWLCDLIFELHGDIFGLIDAGLAINKNNIDQGIEFDKQQA